MSIAEFINSSGAKKAPGSFTENGHSGKINGASFSSLDHQQPQQQIVKHTIDGAPTVILDRRRSTHQIVTDYMNRTHTPRRLRDMEQDLWARRFEQVGLSPDLVVVSKPPFSTREIERMAREGSEAGFMPHVVSGTQERRMLANMYGLHVDRVRDYLGGEIVIALNDPIDVYGDEGKTGNNPNGGFWFRYEDSMHPPQKYRDMTELEMAEKCIEEGKLPITFTLYLAATGTTRTRYGHYIDTSETDATYLTATTHNEKALQVSWRKATLAVNNNPVWSSHYPGLGIRPVEVFDLDQAHTLYSQHVASRLDKHSLT